MKTTKVDGQNSKDQSNSQLNPSTSSTIKDSKIGIKNAKILSELKFNKCKNSKKFVIINRKVTPCVVLHSSSENFYFELEKMSNTKFGEIVLASKLIPITSLNAISSLDIEAFNNKLVTNKNLFQLGSKVVIKKYNKKDINLSSSQENPYFEMYIMNKISKLSSKNYNKNIINVLELIETSTSYFMILPYCDGGDLLDLILKNGPLSENEAKNFFYQIILGLKFIHTQGIVHRDLSLENILLDKSSGLIKFIDFAASIQIKQQDLKQSDQKQNDYKQSDHKTSELDGNHNGNGALLHSSQNNNSSINDSSNSVSPITPTSSSSITSSISSSNLAGICSQNNPNNLNNSTSNLTSSTSSLNLNSFDGDVLIKCLPIFGKTSYLSPEIISQTEFFNPFLVDIWAVGVILFVMLTGIYPYDIAMVKDPKYVSIKEGNLSHLLSNSYNINYLSENVIDLINKILREDPVERLKLDEILNHEWFKKFHEH